ncbi:hypothetical protein C5O00_13915 [Pukyongia salina]|uniref:Uncharacterized protein n=1 Tax=Pukyongia salina TaxID=2094025 RepID=A0A2S0HZU7_9FLAO|nr:hypothetical protein [Pukyongia salina]AVI52191.1 hypothetical protein C5O00_13915 [Pukyongia salina]
MKRKVFKQIIKEFWIQSLISILWGIYRVYFSEEEDNKFTVFISNFSAALFLLSWMFGQFVRVKKQQKIEEEFGAVKSSIISLTENLKAQTKDLIGYSTGGDSIAYFTPSFMKGKKGISLHLTNQSEYPVFDIQVEWIDLNEQVDLANGKFWTRHNHLFGNLYPKKGIMDALRFNFSDDHDLRINLFINTRNKHVSQALRVISIDGVPKIAYRIMGDELIKRVIPDDFPGFDPENPDKTFQ